MRKICTSKHHKGPRWMLEIYFRPRGWTPNKTAPIYTQSNCDACHRIAARVRWEAKRTDEEFLARKNETERLWYRDRHGIPERKVPEPKYQKKLPVMVPVGPFRIWLQNKIQEVSIGGLASAIGVSPRRIYSIVKNSYISNNNGNRYDINFVELRTVDRWMRAVEEHPRDIYPDLY